MGSPRFFSATPPTRIHRRPLIQRLKRGRAGSSAQTILKDALELRDRRDAGQISPHGLRVAKGRLEARMGRVLGARITNTANRRLAKHLTRYQNALFVFLDCPDLEATNWPAAARHPAGRRESQKLRRKPNAARCSHAGGAHEPAPDLPPAGSQRPPPLHQNAARANTATPKAPTALLLRVINRYDPPSPHVDLS